MRPSSRLDLDERARQRLVDVAGGRATADLLLRGGQVLNVYTGELERAAIAIASGRVAWVGKDNDREAEETLHLDGLTVVPGLIDPHCHPDIIYTPSELSRLLAMQGTTLVCADTILLSLMLEDEELIEVLTGMEEASVKFFWNLRGCHDGVLPLELRRLTSERLRVLMDKVPGVVASGEMTAWPQLLRGDARLRSFVGEAINRGLRVDGHAAGASVGTLAQIAAAGVTADHEAISPGELQARLRLGYWVMLRHSTLRPDGARLATGLRELGLPTSRVMLTTDGPVASDVAKAGMDGVVRTIIKAGIDPVEAVKMASLYPATYLGLDSHVGGIAPGRCADILVVDSLEDFHPQSVLCDGKLMTRDTVGCGFTGWEGLDAPGIVAANITASMLANVCSEGPPMRLEGGIITRQESEASGDELPRDAVYVALVSRRGDWMVGATLRGLSFPALASSFTGSLDVLLMGREANRILAAYRRVAELGGGIVTPREEIPLPILGSLYKGTVEELAGGVDRIRSELGTLNGSFSLCYLLLFLSIGTLPDLRLTPRGVLHVKTGRFLSSPLKIAGSVRASGP